MAEWGNPHKILKKRKMGLRGRRVGGVGGEKLGMLE